MRLLRSLGLCVVIGLLWAASAHAAIVGSTVTSPANGTELFYNGDSGSGSVTVRGTVVGATAGTKGDLVCYTVSDAKVTKVASGIDVSSGAFATSASLEPVAGFACRLAMVPAGKTPTGPAAAVFAGPAVSVSDQFSHSSSGNLFGYYILTGTLPWSYAFQSVGECPINSSFATDTSTLGSFSLFTGNACLKQSAGTRSALQIDGQNAYPPAAISALTSRAGFEPLSYTAGFNAAHDALIIGETDTPTICDPPAGFPPTTTTCPSLHDSGIQIQQVTSLLPGGQVARVTQRFASVDGRAHSIDALFSQSVSAQAAAQSPGFQFPGQTAFTKLGAPYSFSSFPAGPGSIAVISDAGGFLPATSNPIGAITYNRPPVSAGFVSASGSQVATLLMHYADAVPAGGAVVYDWSFEQAASSVALQSLEGVERDRFANPIVIIGSPHSGAVTTDSSVRVRGQALDSVGISALTVAGHGVAVGAGGIFGTTVRLRVGKNVILATATNVAGNTSRTSLVMTYKLPSCKVPRLRGKTLATARHMLRKSHCAVGKIKRLHSSHVRKGRVVSSKPQAGSKHRRGTKVGLVISRGR